MKKILPLLAFAVIMQFSAQAQFVRYGGRIANGAAYVSDDLLTYSPICGVTLGGYVDYMFSEWKNPWSENIYIQLGLNFVRRGTNYQQVWTMAPQSIRQGYYHNWYAQIPVIFGFKWEIPQLPANNYLNFFIGPTFNVGLFGRLWERRVTPGMPQPTGNYDTYVTGSKEDRASFKHLRRLDAGVVLGVGYQWHEFTLDVYMDHGFIALMKKDDVLSSITYGSGNAGTEPVTEDKRNAYTGTNKAFMISIGYQLPINK